ncbi:MAG: pyridoxal phosphate-dependent aminotransferase [Bacteroidetes bacterium]|nr:pyridoxal phosphate-dependent aminotransferase [Bacteroidota bacterium]
MALSTILDRFSEPETLKMAKMGRELRAKGFDIIDLSLGEPDFNTPLHIKEAAKRAIDENYSHYTPVAGFMDLREAICQKLKKDNGLEYQPQQIVVSTGAKQCIANAMLALLDQGDEIIIPTPYWVSYSEIARLSGGKVIFLNAKAADGFKITPQQLEDAITTQTKLFIFSSPCNPTGAVYSKEELKALADVFAKHPNIYVISDEIYEYINFEKNSDERRESIAQFDAIKDRVIIVNGMSKSFAMTGWRIGYSASNMEISKACEKIQGQFTSGTNAIAQRASITALNESFEPTFEMVQQFKARKERIFELLKDLPNLKTIEPTGAFYIFPEVKYYFGKKDGDNIIKDSTDLCMYLLNTCHVSTVAGASFGAPDHIRISFANNLSNIEEGFRRLKKGLDQLK